MGRSVLAALLLFACSSGPPPSVVIVTLDTTRVDHLSCYGYERETTPHLDALAERAVRFRRAWSTSSWTLPAHGSLFTGLYPSRHGAHYDPGGESVLGTVVGLPVARHVRAGKLRDDVTTLAELLAARGYQTGAFVAGPWLHRGFGLLRGFEVKEDDVTDYGGRPAHEITDLATSWLRGLATEQPYLLFANYFEPHAPYEPARSYPDLPRAEEAFDPDYESLMRGTATLDADARAVLRDRYDAEIRVMDRELGRLLEEVFARSGGERTIVVVTADHGEALGEEGRFGHGFWLSEEQLRIPLIVRYPFDRLGGTWSEQPIQLVDVLPLLAGELGIALPDPVEGVAPGLRQAAFAELYREATAALRFGDAYDRDLRAAILWPHKLLRRGDGQETLLRLSESGVEERPASEAATGTALASLLDQHVASRPAAPLVEPEVESRTVEALRALGYVE
jgi:arylsulfatase A-like enzyme